ncbi:hypothetical protein B6U67_01060 [Methanosarcinales archaeon ex4484_138]|nr:MAG: hypothetical protein B6U67_01060 [Methanosarcinales archaeon ex4484_138]
MFFDRLFKKKDVIRSIPDLSLLDHAELEKWVVHMLEKESMVFDFDLDGLMNDLGDTIGMLALKIDEMDEIKIETGGRKNKIIEFNKNNMAKQVRAFLDNTVLPADYTYEKLLDFYQKSEQSLRVSLENSLKSYQYVRALIPGSREVIDLIKQINMLLDRMHNQLEEKKKVIDELTTMQEIIRELDENDRESAREEELLCALDEKINRANSKINTIDEEIQEIKGTREWKEYNSLSELKEELLSARERINSQLNNQVSPLVKVLKRLEKQCKSGRHHLADNHKETLKQLLTTPHAVNDPDLFFKYLSELLTRDNLGVSPQKMEKITSHLKYLILSHMFEEQQTAHRKTSLELSKLIEKINKSKVRKKVEELERLQSDEKIALSTLQTEKENHKQRIEQLSSKKKYLEEKRGENIAKLQKSML